MGNCWPTGSVVEQIIKISEDRSPELIVMATQGHQGFMDALRGSTTEQVLRKASCPVLAVPAG
jgi:nucleotide-binding universal stress UspA family protein